MVKLYRGHRIEVVRMNEHLSQWLGRRAEIHYHIELLRDGTPVSEGVYEGTWTMKDALIDLKTAVDLLLGVLE